MYKPLRAYECIHVEGKCARRKAKQASTVDALMILSCFCISWLLLVLACSSGSPNTNVLLKETNTPKYPQYKKTKYRIQSTT